jgi:thioredoxin-dependent peroxiredoxin
VSRDEPRTQKKFQEKYQLPFSLLSDPDASMQKEWGAFGEKNMYGKKVQGTIRSTVVVGPDGKVVRVFPKVKVAGHVAEVLEAL